VVTRGLLQPALLLTALVACESHVRPPGSAEREGRAPRYAHAHNDYANERALLDALDHRFASIEADVWLWRDEIGVSHDGRSFVGSLRDLYLNPLGAVVDANDGSVYGDGRPFFLWIDIKHGDHRLQQMLARQLDEYRFLSRFGDERLIEQGAVTVILTGHAGAKTALVERPAPRPYIRDSNHYSVDDPMADGRWGYYALEFGDYFAWDGTGEFPAAELARLRWFTAAAHRKGRKLRIYGSPEKPAYWEVAYDSGVDFVSTDAIAVLAGFLQHRR
jgi:hypothetical protein